MKHIYIETLGCAKNTVYSEVMAGLLSSGDFSLTNDPQMAEVIIVNTCGFITAAKEESINTLLAYADYKESGHLELLIALGCLVQKYADELEEAMPEVDLFLGTTGYDHIVEIIQDYYQAGQPPIQVDRYWRLPEAKDYEARLVSTPGHYAYLSIAEGCNNRCSYCAIPDMQGPYRSRPMEDILAEAEAIVAQGTRELILIAQDTSYYGLDLYGKPQLATLLRKLCQVEDLEWIRLLYAYPDHITDELITCFKEEAKICNYIDMPLQHINDDILDSMRRHITKAEIKDIIHRFRLAIPDMVFRTTFITGYPGETEDQFVDLLAFLKEAKLDRVGVFPYSQEDRTPAGQMPNQIPEEIREERAQVLMDDQFQIMQDKHRAAEGEERLVVVEEISPDIEGLYLTRSFAEAPDIDPFILVQAEVGAYQVGDTLQVRLTGVDEYDMVGELI
ncbi:30S ribosomal protein S12 methylthiotransferase RimO [Peptococcus simiae]|uniref:30S ribosomal protein S12 methylthiotransferase RimO n=1 Tax=Peptococcus simiae TaxID=1643805 RepID=UPI00397F283B